MGPFPIEVFDSRRLEQAQRGAVLPLIPLQRAHRLDDQRLEKSLSVRPAAPGINKPAQLERAAIGPPALGPPVVPWLSGLDRDELVLLELLGRIQIAEWDGEQPHPFGLIPIGPRPCDTGRV